MKTIKFNIFSLMALLLLFVGQMAFTSCSDDDEAGYGTPEITGVRVPDPEYADSLFTKSVAGQQIAIIGNNLSHVLKIYINDQEVSFNSTMNTDHSVIVTIPTEEDGFKLTAFNSDLKDEIRVETSHGTATYAFKITASYPSISRLAATYPRETGDSMYIYGKNLVDIEKIYFTDIPAAELDTTVWTTIGGNTVDVTSYSDYLQNHYLDTKTNAYTTESVIGMIIPDLPYDKGSLVVETAAGTSYVGFYKKPGQPVINYLSSEYPEIGETVTLTGLEFVQVESITYGDVTLTSDDFTVADSEDEISFVFNKKPTQGSGTTFTITTPGGTASVSNFYNYDCLLVDFDGIGTDNGWGPNATYETASSSAAPYTSDGIFGHIKGNDAGSNWWGTMIYFRHDWSSMFPLPSYDIIPADASADDIYLAMEVYDNNSSFNDATFTGYIRYMIQPSGDAENYYDNGFAWDSYDDQTCTFAQPVLSDIDGQAYKGKWYRHVVKLSNFDCYKGLTYADIVAKGLNQFRLMQYNQGTPKGYVDVCFDNIRLYYNKK